MIETPEAPSLMKFDQSNMLDVLKNFPGQVREGIAIGAAAPYFREASRFPLLVFAGMGGSAIAGDLLRCTLQGYGADDFAVIVNRNYNLPGGVNSNTAVIASSYSGNTEETLAAYDAAQRKTKHLLCIATGGELKKRADADGVPLITIPDGLQPRCAVGYSFMPVLMTLLTHNALGSDVRTAMMDALKTLPEFLDAKAQEYAQPDGANNPAFALAERLRGTIPVFYSSAILEAVNLRWRGQIQENGKHLAFGNILPEMNHNEINSWVLPSDLTKCFSIVVLRIPDSGNRMTVRFKATKNILQERVNNFIEIHAEGANLLEQMFSLLYLADWTSYWLALLNSQDPTEIADILALKAAMTANS